MATTKDSKKTRIANENLPKASSQDASKLKVRKLTNSQNIKFTSKLEEAFTELGLEGLSIDAVHLRPTTDPASQSCHMIQLPDGSYKIICT